MSKPHSKTVSRASVIKRVWLLVALALFTGGIAYPPASNAVIKGFNSVFGTHVPEVSKGFVLGLDLQGGTRLEYEADVSKVPAAERQGALDGVKDVIERRVNSIGVSEPNVTTARAGESWRVSAELAGVRDINEAIKLIGETPILEFKEQSLEPPRDLNAEEKKTMDAANASSTKRAQDALAAALKDPGSMESLAKQLSEDSASKALGGDLGWLREKPEHSLIYAAVKDVAVGTVVNKVVETDTAYAVVKVEERKDAGMEIKANHLLITFLGSQAASSSTTMTKEQAKARIEEIKKEATAKNFVELAKKYSEEPEANITGGDLGWFGKGAMVPEFETPAMALAKGQISDVVESPFGFHLIYKSDERPVSDVRVRSILMKKTRPSDILPPSDGWKATELTGKNLKRAQLDFDQQTGTAQVSLLFDDTGSKLFGEITKRNVGKPVAIFLDGEPISTPVVQTEITGGQAVITGNFTVDESKQLAQRLQAGALPVPIHLIAQQTVGASLGQDSVQRSVTAGLVGFLLVAIFMILLYRLPGLMSIVALVLYAGISGALFKLIPVTLSLAGIAGFILSIGIAVDANVLVFERLKEELKNKSLVLALEEAFRRAWPSIRDGHVTVLISCAVLYWFSSSVIRGFALTLAIGTIISLFTAVVSCRTMLRFVASTPLARFDWLFLKK